MRLAYADPPYLGNCSLYAHRHEAPWGCWDEPESHADLINTLVTAFPDGWALSASAPSLRVLLPMTPDDARIGAWVKSFGAFKRNVRPAFMWEPVIFWRGRNPGNGHRHPPPVKGGKQTTPKDFVVAPITLRKGLTGAKPPKVMSWVLDLLGYLPGDEVVDLFVGTGAMGAAVASRETAA